MTSSTLITCAACGKQDVHKARGWCTSCYRRWLHYGKPPDGPPPRREAVCGTTGGWDKHKRLRTPPCGACRVAHNSAERRRRRRKRGTTGKERYYSTATPRADWSTEQRRAAQVTALVSTGRDDRLLLLEALGLAEPDEAASAATA
ncbi:hypothetical protein DEJ49_33205 [Streptomyces venezuelae]|uniref:Uncharacterized protein n=1 Tax=Streptomyces venezuelae TaxID=54571 RepID=A0A5P2CSD3_STRVZ|nr:hypothetical protein [Streptomyces venezuelae]QES45200.1 hypothetical protein DEJ49_33205 [Streptomyces venezuelae]